MNNKIDIKKSISNLIFTIILFLALYFAYRFYQIHNFNEFIRSEANMGCTEFKRDNKEKYSKMKSYEINSNDFNDAMFSKDIQVERDTPYKVSCMVKTKNVIGDKDTSDIGAQISISDTTERSISVKGDSEWQKIELIFNSKNRTSVNIAFRLGGSDGYAKGNAWFSDFSIEQGEKDDNNNWKFACLIFDNTSVTINNNPVDIQITSNDIVDIKNTINRFEKSCNTLSENKMTADCDIYEIQDPITSLSYDDQF